MRKQKLTQLTPYSPGGVVILTCPLGPTYEKLKFNLLNGLLVSHIDLVVGKINGKPFYTAKGADLQAQNLYLNKQNPSGLLLFDFTLPNAKSSSAGGRPTSQAAEILLTCLPSSTFQSLTFEISINAAAPAAGAIECYSQESDPTNNPFIAKQLYAQYNFQVAQDNDIALPVGPSGGIISQLFFHQTNFGQAGAGAVTNVQVRNAGVIIFEAKPSDIASDQADYGRVQQPGLLVIDYHLQGLREKLLNTTKSNQVFVRLTTNGPTTWTGYTRLIDPAGR
ncbi:hypothetical protein WI80_33370 [Burkholderia ubonensis]|uniref:major capsid protein P2 n=1 Tax=Burkholderia ubonensis TaxID=101571 RepID=UPI00075266D8|nr:major capsid protein P2 [Burkholderia ubonensis]KVD19187.1 hypothetical protein WI80_33370 [Burkholderia ubonensis]KVU12666.1 hypothetical protein WK63_19400 [Burkholderia ubonensis]